MKNILFLAAAAMIFAGCAASGGTSAVNSKKCGSTEVFETCGAEIDKENLIGVYEAKVFCDGCSENSKSTLTLNADGTFKIDTVYQKKIAQRELQTGIYEISGNTLSVTNQYREKLNFEINGDTLRQIGNQNSFIKENFAQERIYKKVEAN
ncbi:copper resistance protein NlpE N-terminal domain-containing protein [uncultured Campylobacter sp.]|uniref:copper resistance protein NlpE N-terminal domain-containing protein n=1 Tax=uncultured Campylobacter sp. TaxID=218934 RepID=UPI00262F33AF|nr:copper resistance protein NlpE N-terminal domain-containing protein [uncultured Campylobacter sp.]